MIPMQIWMTDMQYGRHTHTCAHKVWVYPRLYPFSKVTYGRRILSWAVEKQRSKIVSIGPPIGPPNKGITQDRVLFQKLTHTLQSRG